MRALCAAEMIASSRQLRNCRRLMNFIACSELVPRVMIAADRFEANDLLMELFGIVSACEQLHATVS